MASLRDIPIKRHYESDQDNILRDFFVPALSASKKYDRLSGYFSSTILGMAARGLAQFIRNGGRMRLLIGATLSPEDAQAISDATQEPSAVVTKLLLPELNFLTLEDLLHDRIEALGWMLANDLLEIRIALLEDSALFHIKVGVMEDEEGNQLSFSGSNNETASGWLRNIEEFKVFRGWLPEEKEYFDSDATRFERFWNGDSEKVTVISAPDAIKRKLIDIAPERQDDLALLKRAPEEATSTQERKELRPYQEEAVQKWAENGMRGIFAMATGTGKTLTALGAVERVYKQSGGYCVVLAVPYKHLVTQWIKDVEKQLPDATIIEAHSDAADWRKKMPRALGDYQDGFLKQLVIVTVYATLASDDFLGLMQSRSSKERLYMIIADEVHNFGAPQNSKGMLDFFNARLGLSATHTRYFDDPGTDSIVSYFNDVVYEYPLKQAIEEGLLVPYDYFPIFVRLTVEEFDEYQELSKKILRSGSFQAGKLDNRYQQMLLFNRSRIMKSCKNKIEAFDNLIAGMQKSDEINHLLVYCDAGGQLEEAQKMINKYGVINCRFTQEESLKEREKILESFDEGVYKCLVAIKCLDEGVNVPSTKTAIILASTGNPREYIQRRGRVLRKYPGKDSATIYDFFVLPPEQMSSPELKKIERGILKKEFRRVQEFLETARNKADIMNKLGKVMAQYDVYLD